MTGAAATAPTNGTGKPGWRCTCLVKGADAVPATACLHTSFARHRFTQNLHATWRAGAAFTDERTLFVYKVLVGNNVVVKVGDVCGFGPVLCDCIAVAPTCSPPSLIPLPSNRRSRAGSSMRACFPALMPTESCSGWRG